MVKEIPKIVINLPDRIQRLHDFKQEVKYMDSDYGDIMHVMGERQTPPWKGIAASHLKAIALAKQLGLPKVLIMEDDVMFPGKEKTLAYMEEAFKKIPNDWDVILGGVYYLRNETKVNNYWRRIGEFCALHWYIVNERVYDRILNEYDETNHIDRWMGKQDFKIYLPRRLWAIQRDGYSDNVQRETDYNNTYLKNFEILR